MASKVVESKDVCRILDSCGSKWIVYKRQKQADTVVLGVSNGSDIWQRNFTQSSLPAWDLAKLQSDDISVAQHADKITLTVGAAKNTINLQKVNATERSTELSTVLFFVAEKHSQINERLTEANKTIESLKRTAASNASAHVSVFDMTADAKKKKTQPKAQPKQPGMSIVNPGSRKRTKAKGVEFD